jgi:hypothetical protein
VNTWAINRSLEMMDKNSGVGNRNVERVSRNVGDGSFRHSEFEAIGRISQF